MKIWEKYFISQTVKSAVFFLLAFYGLYALIDYASHTGTFHHHHTKLSALEVLLFYLSEFFRRSEVLIPLALMIGTIRTLTQLNVNHELVALKAAGISTSRLMRPFLLIGFLAVLLLYGITEWIEPLALKEERSIETTHLVDAKDTGPRVNHLKLEDASTLLFQKYDKTAKTFYDLIWVKSADEIYRMKYLDVKSIPQGFYIEVIKRKNGQLTLESRLKEKLFDDLKFSSKRLIETVTPPEERSLTRLAAEIKPIDYNSEKETHALAVFLRKIILPWLAVLAVIGVVPFCIEVTRDLKVFSIYAISLFGLVFIYIVINAGTTLSERQVANPYLAILAPFAMIALGLISRFYGAVRS